MNALLKELSITDGQDIKDMLKEIGPGENGFLNDAYNADFTDFLQKYISLSKGKNLEPNQVPITMYWLYIDGKPVGYGKLRHYLNDQLMEIGGHIGYAIRPSERGKSYGKIVLKELLKEAKEKGIDQVLMTCLEKNIPSRKVIESNNGFLSRVSDGECYYWIKL
ncbi:hypothetical protein N752_12955 [Desulforamulus aquiferis]|nr:GNAT family N-acetyltransferase [Desulforamulus aquiferis]RYD04829.1 hypothetical protein N752_12955 [Desulforamulus aquiferis]